MSINNSACLAWWQNTMHLMEQFISIMLHCQGKHTASGRGNRKGCRRGSQCKKAERTVMKDIKGKFKELWEYHGAIILFVMVSDQHTAMLYIRCICIHILTILNLNPIRAHCPLTGSQSLILKNIEQQLSKSLRDIWLQTEMWHTQVLKNFKGSSSGRDIYR